MIYIVENELDANAKAKGAGIRAVFMDFDGVVVDSERIYQRFWKEAFEAYGYKTTPSILLSLRSCEAKSGEKIMRTIYSSAFPYSEIRKLRSSLMDEYVKSHPYQLKKGVLDFLAFLKERGIAAFIVSSSYKEKIEKEIKRLGISSFFSDALSAKDVKNGKPYPDVYLKAIELSGFAKEEIIVIEDSPNGICSAFGAGLKVIMADDIDKASKETSKMIIGEVSEIDELINHPIFLR